MGKVVVVSLLFFSLLTAPAVLARPVEGKERTLVLLDDNGVRRSHATFFSLLEERGHTLTFKEAEDGDASLTSYGEYLFDNLVLFAPTAQDLRGMIDVHALVDFVDSGHNVLVAGASDLNDLTREFGAECGVEFDESGTFVMDHLNFDALDAEGDHTRVLIDQIATDATMIVGTEKYETPVVYRGVGMAIDDQNPLVTKIMWGSPTTYSFFEGQPIRTYPQSAGLETVLVAAMQARNNARVTFFGSLEMCSDVSFKAAAQRVSGIHIDKTANKQLCTELSKWTFHERGVLRHSNHLHHRVGESGIPHFYRVKDNLEYEVHIEQWTGEKWDPFVGQDVQVEFVRIDPYIRRTLNNDGASRFTTAFQVPDVNGVYKFRVDYWRPGLTRLFFEDKVIVRPFRHNEFERFIPTAFPYYAGAFSMMFGFFIFGWVYLYNRSD